MIDGIPLIDAHVHAPALEGLTVPWKDWTGGFSSGETTRALYENGRLVPERFHAYLEQQGVDIALVFAEYSPKVTGIQSVEDMLPLVEHDPGRVRLVANLNPHLHYPAAAELERQLALGAVALKIHPVHGGFPVNARALYKAYALCEERGIPVVVHFGTSVYPGSSNRFIDAGELNDVVDDRDLRLAAQEAAGVLRELRSCATRRAVHLWHRLAGGARYPRQRRGGREPRLRPRAAREGLLPQRARRLRSGASVVGPTRQLAAFVARTRFDDIPDDVVDAARLA